MKNNIIIIDLSDKADYRKSIFDLDDADDDTDLSDEADYHKSIFNHLQSSQQNTKQKPTKQL